MVAARCLAGPAYPLPLTLFHPLSRIPPASYRCSTPTGWQGKLFLMGYGIVRLV